MRPEFSDWDPAETIGDEGHARLYLEEYAKDGSSKEIAEAIKTIARAYGMRLLATQAGISPTELFEAVGRLPNPEMSELLKILEALGVSVAKHSDAAE